MKDRFLTEEEIKELPNLFCGGEWFGKNGCLGHVGLFFARRLRDGNCMVFARNYEPDGVRLVNTPYERLTETYVSRGRDPNRTTRLNDDGHF